MKIVSYLALLLLSFGAVYYTSALRSVSDKHRIFTNHTTFDQFLGVNSIRESNSDIIQDQYQVARFHRIFAMDSYLFTGTEFVTYREGNNRQVDLSIPHDEYPDDKMGFNPSKALSFNFDRFLATMKANGLKSIPVLARNLLYNNVPDNNIINVWQIPYDDGGDPENPMDYKAYASFLYQFTARYGKSKLRVEGGTIDPRLLKLAPDNEIRAGLDLVFAIEPGNEMDKEWFSDREQASVKEMAAFLSAAIDGHMGLMGEGHGILVADPSMKIVFPSPSGIKSDYVLDVLDELKQLRSDALEYGWQVIPEENLILSAHFYPFKNKTIFGQLTSDIVENTELIRESINFLETVRSKYNCPVYMTETGYDKVVKGASDIGAPVNSSDRMESSVISTYAQAKHICRLLLTMYALGYDKTFLFTLRDPVAVGVNGFMVKYATSGLTRKNGEKDPAWYVIDHLRKKLTGFYLEHAELNDTVKLLKLKKRDMTAFIYWVGTNDNTKIMKKIPVKEKYGAAYITALSDFAKDFPSKNVDLKDEIEVEVTEFPRILIHKP